MSSVGFFGVFILIMLVYLVIFGVFIANYVMQALGLYTIADRRQIKNPWLAWIPYANYWLIGSLADDYDGCHGIKRKWRVVLLVLSLVVIVGFVLMYVIMFAAIFTSAFQYEASYYDYYSYDYYMEPSEGEIIGLILAIYLPIIPVIIASSALQICNAICFYKIYESTVPQKALKYMLLSLLVPLARGICLMKCRKQGYERPKMWYYPMQPAYAPPVQTVVQQPETMAAEPLVEQMPEPAAVFSPEPVSEESAEEQSITEETTEE